jgi:hypothetical protein
LTGRAGTRPNPAGLFKPRADADRGDTLVEVLIALVIIGLTVSGLLGSLLGSVAASGQHRSNVTLDAILKSFADVAKYDIQLQPIVTQPAPGTGPEFVDCATTATAITPASYTVLGGPSPANGSATTAVTIFGTGYAPMAPLTASMNTVPASAPIPLTLLSGGVSDTQGDVALTFSVPPTNSAPLGSYSITVGDGNHSATSTDSFTVTSNAPATTSPLAGYHLEMASIGWWNSTLTPPNFDPSTGSCKQADQSGIQEITLTATAQDGISSSLAFVVTNPATAAPIITSPATANFTGGIPGTFTLNTTGYPTPALSESGTLPANVSFTDDGNGNGTLAGTPASTSVGSYSIVFTAINSNGMSTQSFTFVVSPGAATNLAVVSGSPQSAVVTTGFANPLVALVTDAMGNPVPGVVVTFNVPGSGASGTFANGGVSTTATTASNGDATSAAFTANTIAGTYHVVASATGTTSATFALTNSAGAPTTVTVVSGSQQSATVNSSYSNLLVTQVADFYGNPAPGITVTYVAPSAGPSGTFANATATTTAVTGSNGQAVSSTLTAGIVAGSFNVVASASGATSATFALSNTAAAASKLGFTTAAISGPASNNATLGPITVQVQDAFGNPVNAGTGGTTVNLSSNSTGTKEFSLTSGGAAVTSVSIATGSSSASFYYGDTKEGTPNITAAGAALTSGNQSETVTGGVGTKLVITSSAFTASASSAATNGFTTTLEDQFNNPTTTASPTTINLSSTSSAARFSASSGGTAVSTVTLSPNTQSVTAYYGDTKVGTPTITVAATPYTTGVQPETIIAAGASKLVVTSATFTATASSSASSSFTVTSEDQFGNLATSASATTVNLSSSSGGAKFAAASGGTGVTSVSLPAGAQSIEAFYGDMVAGSALITASATGLTSGTQSETILPGTGTKLAITSTAFTAPASSSSTSAFTVTLEDQFGNPTTSASATTVNLSSSSGGGAFSATSGGPATASVSVAANTQSATAFYGDIKAGSPTISVAASGLTPGSQVETVTGSGGTRLVVTSAAFTAPASSSASSSFTVTLEDQFGNPTMSASATTVNLSSSSGGAKFAAASGGTGVTSVSLLAGAQSVVAFYGDTKAGTPTITAAATGLTSATQPETISPAAVSQLVVTSTAVSGVASSSASLGPVSVQEQDAFGNVTTTAETVTLSSNSTGAVVFSATLNGPSVSSVSIPGGSSAASFFYGDTKAGAPTITASATGLSSGIQSETIVAGSATQFGFTSVPVFGPAAASALLGPITVAEQDGFGNPVTATGSGTTVNLASSSTGTKEFSASSGGATVTSVTIPAGSSSVSFFYGDSKAGTPTITASGTLASGTQAETVTGSAGSKLGITSTPFSVTASSSATASFTTTLEDQFSNPTTSASPITINLSSTSLGAKFAASSGGTATSNISLASNTQSITAFYGDTKAGSPTITAAVTGLTSAMQPETIVAGVGSQLAITSPVFTATASNSATNAFTVTLEDTFSNATTNASAITINLTSSSSGAKFSATSGGSTTPSVFLPANTQSVTAFYSDTVAGTPTITSAATGLTSGAQPETITAAGPAALVYTSCTSPTPCTNGTDLTETVGNGGTYTAHVGLIDAFGNSTTSSAALTINLSQNPAGTGTLTPTSLTLPANAAQTTNSFTFTLPNGKPPTVTVTASASGQTWTAATVAVQK